ncbi:hypothetical protein ES703_121626 [subsurface metagenome]
MAQTLKQLKNDLFIKHSTKKDYYALAPYHYIKRTLGPTNQVYTLGPKADYKKIYPDPIGVIVYAKPVPHLKARNLATKNIFTKPKGRSAQLKLVNKNVLYISRIIIDPRFRRCGLATWLLHDTLEMQTIKYIETLTPIDFTNNLFEHAGFRRYRNPRPERYSKFISQLQEFGIFQETIRHSTIVQKRLEALEPEQREEFYFAMKQFLIAYPNLAPHFWEPGTITFALYQLSYPQAYLLWTNKKPGKSKRHPL